MAKFSKDEVDYSRGMKSSHCGICLFYHKNVCDLVSGFIHPEMWCKKFKKKPGGEEKEGPK